MKKCNHCNGEVRNNANFCQHCGAEIDLGQPKAVEVKTVDNKANVAPPLPNVNVYDKSDDNTRETPPPNKSLVWLILSSVLTFLGCACFGIGIFQVPTIITSAIAQGRYSRGDYEGSDRLARISMILFFSILAFSIIIGILVAVFYYGMFDFADVFDTYY